MATFLSISASPQAISSTHAVLSHVNRRLLAAGHTVRTLPVRELPPGPLLAADSSDPEIAEAIEAVAGADALVVATPGVSGRVLRAAQGLPRCAAAVRFSRQVGAADRHRRISGARAGR